MRLLRCAIAALLLPGCASAAFDGVTGIVNDDSGAVIPGVHVLLLRADQSVVASATTSEEGRFQFPAVPSGSYWVTARRSSFSPARVWVRVSPDSTGELVLRLSVEPLAVEVSVTAETAHAPSVDELAQRTNVIPQTLIDQRVRTVTADLFREEVGVDVQRTAPAMGGVAVRGLLGKNVAVYRDGVRYTTSAQRGGVSTFWNLAEATNMDSVEVLRGPNSAQYGSDSIGGTVHYLSRIAPLRTSQGWHGEFAPMYYSPSTSFGGNLLASYGGPRAGALVNVASRRVNRLRTGGGADTHAAVTRFLGLPSTVFGEHLPDTGFTQYGGMFHAQYMVSGKSQLVAHYERSQMDGAKRYDQLLGGDGNLIADLRNLMLDFGYLRYTRFEIGSLLDQVAATVSFNSQREERVNQGGNGNPLAAITYQHERTRVFGTSFYAAKRLGRHDAVVGGDGYHESEQSPAFTVDPVRGAVTFTRPRVPDGARYLLYGLYLQDAWEPFSRGQLRVTGAVRFGGASYRSRSSYSPLVNGRPLWPDDGLAANAVSGRIGVVGKVSGPLRAHFNYSRGFRTPGITDLGTVGIQGNGFFESSYADLAGRSAMVGDRADDRAVSSGKPVAPVRPESSDNYDAGFTLGTSRVRADVNGFWMGLNSTIVSQTLILPQGAVGQPLGDQVVTRQLPSGAVFVPAATNAVLVRSNLGAASVYGFEQRLEAKVAHSITFGENLTWLYAEDQTTGLAPDIEGGTPPLTANLRLRWAPAHWRFWVEPYSTLADRQDRLSSLALSDRRTGASRSRTNIANFFNNGARVRGLVANGILVPTGETLAQVQNRVLGSAASAPMFAAIPGYALFGIRGGYQVTERSDLFLDFSNIFDQRHRGISWGIDGAGRGLAVHFRYRF